MEPDNGWPHPFIVLVESRTSVIWECSVCASPPPQTTTTAAVAAAVTMITSSFRSSSSFVNAAGAEFEL